MQRTIIISESQKDKLVEMLREEQYMPVPKSTSKPYTIDPEKVLIVKRYLDSSFQRGTFEKIGENGYPTTVRIVAMLGKDGNVMKNMYLEQLKELLEDRYQKMFSDHDELGLFLEQVINDWFDKKISIQGMLSVNHL